MNADQAAQEVTDFLVDALNQYDDNRDRSQQSRRGGLGMSSLGFCRNYAVLTLKQTPRDERVIPEGGTPIWSWPAQVGSAVHNWVDDALEPHGVIIGSRVPPVTATFPQSGATVSGHFDWYLPDYNLLLDGKTKNRTAYSERTGPDENAIFQRHTYAKGLVEAGIAQEDDLLVGNAFFDRSGVDKRPYLSIASYDPTLTNEVDMWIEDVLYAYQHDEPASQDKPFDFCERFCEFFLTCRGGVMEDTHDPTLILDPETVDAARLYAEGLALEREGRAKKDVAKPRLATAAGRVDIDGEAWQIRHVQVNESTYKRSAHERLDVRRMPKRR